MLQHFDIDPDKRFKTLMNDVSHQIESTDHPDGKIAEICSTSSEFVRRQRKFLSLGPYKENEMAKKIQISYEDLYREYIENKKTIKECAKIFGCSAGAILSRMKEHSIEARTRGGYPKNRDSANGKPPDTIDTSEEITTSEQLQNLDTALKEHPEVVPKKDKRLLERLILLSAVKEASIQELLEEALELLFEKYAMGER